MFLCVCIFVVSASTAPVATGSAGSEATGFGSNLATSAVGASNSVAYSKDASAQGQTTFTNAVATNDGSITANGAGRTIADTSNSLLVGGGVGGGIGGIDGYSGQVVNSGASSGSINNKVVTGWGATSGSSNTQFIGSGTAGSQTIALGGAGAGQGSNITPAATAIVQSQVGPASNINVAGLGPAKVVSIGASQSDTTVYVEKGSTSIDAVSQGNAANTITTPDNVSAGAAAGQQATSLTSSGKEIGATQTNSAGGLVGNAGSKSGSTVIGASVGGNTVDANRPTVSTSSAIGSAGAASTLTSDKSTTAFTGVGQAGVVNQGRDVATNSGVQVVGNVDKSSSSGTLVAGATSDAVGKNLYQSGAASGTLLSTNNGVATKYKQPTATVAYTTGDVALAGQVSGAQSSKAYLTGSAVVTGATDAGKKSATGDATAAGSGSASIPFSSKQPTVAVAGGQGSSQVLTSNGQSSAGAIGSSIGGAAGAPLTPQFHF